MTALHWPPRNRDEMLAWQREYGTDGNIAEAAGVSRRRANAARIYWEVDRFYGHGGGGHDWPEQDVDKLRRLWDEGLSCSQIAREIGKGLSRDAIIGKAHRLELPSRASPIKGAKGSSHPAKKQGAREELMRIHPILDAPNADLLDWTAQYITDAPERSQEAA